MYLGYIILLTLVYSLSSYLEFPLFIYVNGWQFLSSQDRHTYSFWGLLYVKLYANIAIADRLWNSNEKIFIKSYLNWHKVAKKYLFTYKVILRFILLRNLYKKCPMGKYNPQLKKEHWPQRNTTHWRIELFFRQS